LADVLLQTAPTSTGPTSTGPTSTGPTSIFGRCQPTLSLETGESATTASLKAPTDLKKIELVAGST